MAEYLAQDAVSSVARDSDYFSRLTDWPSQARFFIERALLAPSSHNIQPWKFRIERDAIVVIPDERRKLPASDPDERDWYISIGCGAEYLAALGRACGYHTNASFAGDKKEVVVNFGERVGKGLLCDNDKFENILTRRTARTPYKEIPPTVEVIEKIKEAGESIQGSTLEYVVDPQIVTQVAVLIEEAFTAMIHRSGFRREMAGMLRSGYSNTGDGLPIVNMGIPSLLSYILPKIIKIFPLTAPLIRTTHILARATPAWGIITTREDAPGAWINVGRTFVLSALRARESGIAMHPQSSICEIPELRDRLIHTAHLENLPQLIFRIGFPERTGQIVRPRRDIQSVMVS